MSKSVELPALLREPLLHFLLIGLGLFLMYGQVAPKSPDSRDIHVTRAQVEALASQYQKLWNRAPEPQELANLVEATVRDEVMYREGLALGLAAEDPVIKRRVRQKLEVSTEELLAQGEASDAELAGYLQKHADQFMPAPRISFEQVPVPAGGTVQDAQTRVAVMLSALNGGADPAPYAAASMLPAALRLAPLDLVARDFGEDFAKQLPALPVGQWQGPVVSGYGLHLVRVTDVQASQPPTLEQVRPQVLREWENARRERNRELAYQAMRANYRITVDAELPGGRKP